MPFRHAGQERDTLRRAEEPMSTVELITTLFDHVDESPRTVYPRCTISSSSIHHRYQRHLNKLPWGTHAGRLCQHSRHKGEANAVDRSNPVDAVATILINWAQRS
jgi:hypothetical protein